MLPKKLQDIVNELQSAKWLKPILNKADVYVVGGIVRDAFLGRPSKDVDLIVEGMPIQDIVNTLKPFGKLAGDEEKDGGAVGKSFSVIKFTPKGFQGEPYDIATPRMDRKIGSGHKGFEIITDGVDLLTDLKRRDFTINSMAVNVKNGELIDPFDGQGDLMSNLLRATDKEAFIEDPLRIVRGIQFAARFGFSFAPDTMQLMKGNAMLVKEISGERIFDELMKIINKNGSTDEALSLLSKTGLDQALFDKKMITYTDGLGKMDATSFFYVLGLLGGVDPSKFLKKRLKGNNELVNDVRILNHIITQLPHTPEEEDRKFMLFKAFNKAPQVIEADALPTELDDVVFDFKTGKIPWMPEDIAISGDDVMALGNLKEGPEVGRIKEKIQRDALMNRFDWKNRENSLVYLENLLN